MVLFQTYFQVPEGYDAGITFLEELDTYLHQKFPEIWFKASSLTYMIGFINHPSRNTQGDIKNYHLIGLKEFMIIIVKVDKPIGRWLLEEQGVCSPFSGVSNNQSESFNAVMKQVEAWKEVPVDSWFSYFTTFSAFL